MHFAQRDDDDVHVTIGADAMAIQVQQGHVSGLEPLAAIDGRGSC